MINNPASDIAQLLKMAIGNSIFPGAAVAIITNNQFLKRIFFGVYGYTDYKKCYPVNIDTVYDLASLTKPLATTLALFSLIKYKKVSLLQTLPSLLECQIPDDKKNISLFHLLNHSAGFIPHQDFFLQVKEIPKERRLAWLLNTILNYPLNYQPGSKQQYSDLGFMILGMIIEKKTQLSLAEYVNKKVFVPLGVQEDLFYPRATSFEKNKIYAPTEECSWRQKLLCGEVHDDNAASMSGVAGHAGLFGTIKGVTGLVGFLLDAVQGRVQHPFIDNDSIQQAVKRQSDIGTWGLGFDTKSPYGSSSGHYLSPLSFGHLGYTGTSFWVDPVQDMAIILLSNRVNPSRNNEQIKTFRPLFHDAVMKIVRDSAC